MSKEQAPKGQKPTWITEEFYFGNANHPSWAIYRHSGERLQVRKEMPLPLVQVEPDGFQYEAELEGENPWSNIGVIDFLKTYQDCKILMHDGIAIEGGGYRKPSIWIVGWQEVTTPEGRQYYEQDKVSGRWKK